MLGEMSSGLLYKYRSAKIGKVVLQSGTLRWSAPQTFLDHEDSRWDVFWNRETQEFRQSISSLLLQFVQSNRSMGEILPQHREYIREIKSRFWASFDVKEARYRCDNVSVKLQWPSIKPTVEKQWASLGRVLCLCKDASSKEMWGQYGDDGKGIALGLIASRLLPRHGFGGDVTYARDGEYPRVYTEEQLARMTLFKVESDTRMMRSMALTKALCWSHEQEYRIVQLERFDESKLDCDLPFPADALAEVVFGPRIDEADARSIQAIVDERYPGARVRRLGTHS